MQTSEFLEEVYLLRRELKDGSASVLRRTVICFDDWLGRPSTLKDFSEDVISRFVRDKRDAGKKPRYVRRLRTDLIGIWREASRHDKTVPTPIEDQIRRVRVPRTAPEAWTVAEVRLLREACDAMRGFYNNGVNRSAFWKAYISSAWDTGLRQCDLLALRLDDVREDGAISVLQQKTGVAMMVYLTTGSIDLIRATIPPSRELVFPWEGSEDTFRDHFARIAAKAGLKGTPKKLRKSAATDLELIRPGSAQQFLGQLTPGLAEKHYIDPRISQAQRPSPRSLDEQPRRSTA